MRSKRNERELDGVQYDYRKYREECAAKENKERGAALRRQGEILAKAMESQCEQSVGKQMVVTGLLTTTPLQLSPGQSSTVSQHPEEQTDLTPMKRKMVEAELGNKSNSPCGKQSDFTNTLTKC